MPDSPDQQWRQLTAHYAQMWDDELLNLAADYKDLTDMAQQVLRDEMRKRNLGDPARPQPKPVEVKTAVIQEALPRSEPPFTAGAKEPTPPRAGREEREWQRCRDHYAGLGDEDLEDLVAEHHDLTPVAQLALRDVMMQRGLGNPEEQAHAPQEESSDNSHAHPGTNPLLAAAELRAQSVEPNEWWVSVLESSDRERATQCAAMLSAAGILHRWRSHAFSGDTVEVAAEQAEEAERVLAQTVPQSVIDESKVEVPEYQLPHCPRCQNQEPTLIATEPSNQWQCESCGNEWCDSVVEPK
jgi:hypothetical protein